MADRVFWFTIENRPWDLCPQNVDRMMGTRIEDMDGMAPPVAVTLFSPISGATTTRTMYRPLGNVSGGVWEPQDALIFRRYTENWGAPADQKVNPWDFNEPNPTDGGTMGTIPGPTIECNVGDRIIVHFKNLDFRARVGMKERCHSMHPHGVVFNARYDGAYPLSPPDTTQPVDPAERPLWDAVGVTGAFKLGDRIPPGATFTYTWNTFGWPSTAGVWHYHDHAICDVENVALGALGFLVVHNPEDPDDVIDQDLPHNSPNGPLVNFNCFPLPFPLPLPPVFPGRFFRLGDEAGHHDGLEDLPHIHGLEELIKEEEGEKKTAKPSKRHDPLQKFAFQSIGDFGLVFEPEILQARLFCVPRLVNPPRRAQYLQYYHEFPSAGMVINGRKYLGNTPTLIAGTGTKMRFGLAGMNSMMFHTFHLHGHRWVIPGPAGTNPIAIQSSPQVQAVSQFEDTRIFGPANSFSFTINQGSFMGSLRGAEAPGVGEWHMHCHVLSHMMPDGMMGSLLVINGGELAFSAMARMPQGEECMLHGDGGDEGRDENTVMVMNTAFSPRDIFVRSGDTVTFEFHEAFHTVTTTSAGPSVEINQPDGSGVNPANAGNAVNNGTTATRVIVGAIGQRIDYMCGIHGAGMSGSITIIP